MIVKVLIDIGHPAHVHLYKYIIKNLESNGHQVKITVREKEITSKLLSIYNFKFERIVSYRHSLSAKAISMINRTLKLYKLVKSFKPDLMTGFGNFHLAHVGRLLGIPTIILTDTESARLQNFLTFPFCDFILTPSCYKNNISKKQIRYNGYHELAYLHPNYFRPDPSIFDLLGIEKNEKYVIIRFVSWGATHDVGHTGLSLDIKRKAVKEFSKLSTVFITSELKLPNDLEKYRIKISPEKIHNALFYASLLYGESATMASECAVLGTPAIYLDNKGRGYTDEEEKKFGLVFNFTESIKDQELSIRKAVEILETPDIKKMWQKKRKKLLSEKIDVTAFMTWFVENYPESVKIMKENPGYQSNFKSADYPKGTGSAFHGGSTDYTD